MDGIKLNDGYVVPRLGLGTFRISRPDAERSVEYALRNGYSLIDTANVYFNEEAVGRGIKNSGKAREEIFLTSKIFPVSFDDFEKAVDGTLERLQVDYLDLLLLHRPYGNFVKAYKDLIKAKEQGKVRSIGVSNFSLAQLKKIIDATGVVPAVNQIELNPYYPRLALQDALNERGIVTQSWYPFGGGAKAGLFDDGVLVEIAASHGATVAQIILAYLLARNVIAIPGSKSEAHIKDNFAASSITLSESELNAIKALDKHKEHRDFGRPFYKMTPKNFFEE